MVHTAESKITFYFKCFKHITLGKRLIRVLSFLLNLIFKLPFVSVSTSFPGLLASLISGRPPDVKVRRPGNEVGVGMRFYDFNTFLLLNN